MFGLGDPGSRLASARRARGMSVVIAGAVALGLMPLGVPVASAASPSGVSSIVATGSTSRAAVRGLATQAIPRESLSAAVTPSLAAAVFPEYTYEMSFRIKRSALTSKLFFDKVQSNFVALFPIAGAKPLAVGARMILRPPGPAFPVYVQMLTSYGWIFKALPGHPDYPGFIGFKFTKVGPDMYLNVHGFIPPESLGGKCFSFLPCRIGYMLVVKNTWTRFAGNLTRV